MAETFLQLSVADRRDALEQAAAGSTRPVALLEKDVWVVWAIDRMFESPYGTSLVFKGGTSLSKAHRIIRRFSEDVDLTYDIRSLAPDLTQGEKVLPDNPSQEKRWTKLLRGRLEEWVATEAMPHLGSSLAREGLNASLEVTGEKIRLTYEPVLATGGYVAQAVLLEFGGRSTGEPCDVVPIACDAARWLPELAFPTAAPRVMSAERTFWEKATAIHVFCLKGRFAGTDRYSRHWHDLARLDDAGVVERALADGKLASEVATHKSVFFAEKDSGGDRIDYHAAVGGSLRLVPEGQPREDLAVDYSMMRDAGLLDDAETFDTLIERCESIERRANGS